MIDMKSLPTFRDPVATAEQPQQQDDCEMLSTEALEQLEPEEALKRLVCPFALRRENIQFEHLCSNTKFPRFY